MDIDWIRYVAERVAPVGHIDRHKWHCSRCDSKVLQKSGVGTRFCDEGFNDLRTSGLKKVKDGLTSLEEVNRVTTGH